MTEATLTSKNQITVPKAVRQAMGLVNGTKIQFVPARNGFRLVAIPSDFAALKGFAKGRRAEPLSIEAMNACIAEMGTPEEVRA
jgi:antitoxin PrlF